MGRAEREGSVACGALYHQVKGEFAEMMEAIDQAQRAVRVPATPGWTVHDVLAHVVGLAAALNALDLPAPDDEGGTAWAARQVATRASRPIAELLAEWDAEAPVFADGLDLFGYEFGCHFVADLLVHLLDVQAALGVPSCKDPIAMSVALDHYCDHVGGLMTSARWGVLVVESTDGEQWSLGAGDERARVRAPLLELVRSLSARRSERQVRALHWSGDLDGVIAFLRHCWSGGYALPAVDQP